MSWVATSREMRAVQNNRAVVAHHMIEEVTGALSETDATATVLVSWCVLMPPIIIYVTIDRIIPLHL
jgi:hypothetical protein